MVYAGKAIDVAAMIGGVDYGTSNQENYLQDDAVLAPASEQRAFSAPTGLGAELNKEPWHEDPFGDIA